MTSPDPQRRTLGPVAEPTTVDDVDRGMIEALQGNGRASFREIARAVGVSEATVRARYQRLCEQNVLQVVGVTNPLSLGFDAIAMLGVKINGSPEVIAAEIAEWREATYVVLTAGQFDLLVELVCVDRRHLLEILSRVRALDGVASAEAFMYLMLVKQLYNWGARATRNQRAAGERRAGRAAGRASGAPSGSLGPRRGR